MTKNRILEIMILVLKSLFVGLLVLLIIYTLYFFYLGFIEFPNRYHAEYGKGAGAYLDSSEGKPFYCTRLIRIYKCDLMEFAFSYFEWMLFYIIVVPQMLLASITTSIIYFIKNYDT